MQIITPTCIIAESKEEENINSNILQLQQLSIDIEDGGNNLLKYSGIGRKELRVDYENNLIQAQQLGVQTIKMLAQYKDQTKDDKNNKATQGRIDIYSLRLKKIINYMNESRTELNIKQKTRVKQQLKQKAVGDDMTIDEENIDDLAQNIITSGMEGQVYELTWNKLDKARENYHGMLEIEKGMRELLMMFNDCALLVTEQGVELQQVQKKVQSSVVHIQKGRKQLSYAIREQQRCCCIT